MLDPFISWSAQKGVKFKHTTFSGFSNLCSWQNKTIDFHKAAQIKTSDFHKMNLDNKCMCLSHVNFNSIQPE